MTLLYRLGRGLARFCFNTFGRLQVREGHAQEWPGTPSRTVAGSRFNEECHLIGELFEFPESGALLNGDRPPAFARAYQAAR